MRCGDTVRHGPTGETWQVAYVDGDYMSWCGWPPGEAKTTDCTIVKTCSDEEHLDLLKRIAVSYNEDKRNRMARLELEALEIGVVAEVRRTKCVE